MNRIEPIEQRDERPPYGVAAVVSAAILMLYVVTIAPTTQFWDTSEYIAAAKVLGIPHPPGNPLFVLMANVWGMIPTVSHYALRINLFAAITSALASGLLFLVAARFLRAIIPEPRWARLSAAAAGIFVGATSFTVWNQSVVNEKVYTLSLFSIALVLWLAVRWSDQPAGERRDHWLVLIVYLLALGSTNHQMGLLVVPAVLVLVVLTDPGVFMRWRIWVAGILVAAAGLTVFVMLPIRARHFPPINEGEPTSWEALRSVLNREQYQKGPLLPRQADILWQYANYIQYFGWQFAHDWGTQARRAFGLLFGAIGLLGAVRHWQRDRRSAMAMTALMATVTLLLVFYLDFKYGYSIRQGENLIREVRERDYFFLASFQLWGIWVALGFGLLLETASGMFGEHGGANGSRRWATASPVLLLALIPLFGNRLTAPRSGEWLPRDFAWDILQSVEPYGILVTAGDNDTFPLWYMQEVEGVRKDVLVANLSLANTQWHGRQLKRREIFPFDSANAIELYRNRSWTTPTHPVLSISYEQLDALPLVSPISPDRNVLRIGNIRSELRQQYFERADWIVLQLIRDNLGKRPIYFSRTVGGYADNLGLTPYLLGQGLVRRLIDGQLSQSDSITPIPVLGWVDVPRTTTLLFDVYHAESVAAERPRGWVDSPSSGIMALYALLYGQYADYMRQTASDSATAAAADSATVWAERMTRQAVGF